MSRSASTRYPIAAVRERIHQRGGPILDFVVGRHREDPPAALRELLSDNHQALLLTPCSLDEREAVAKAAATMLERVYGTQVSPAGVLPVPGGRTAMSFLASCLIRPNEDVAIIDPAYPAFWRVAHQLGARVHRLFLDPARGFDPDLSPLDGPATREVGFAALNYPNNPTGAIISDTALADLLGRLAPNTVVFNDATYGPLTYGVPPWSLLARAGEHGRDLRVVELHSLAKMFSLGPIPVAFLAGEEAIIGELREYSEYAWSDQSSLQVRIALQCLQDDDHVGIMRRRFHARAEKLLATLRALGFAPFPVFSGMYAVCPVPAAIRGTPVASAAEAAQALLDNFGVAVVPWEVEPHEYLRFSAQYHDDDLVALASLGALATQ